MVILLQFNRRKRCLSATILAFLYFTIALLS
ncbi:MAG: hypothetical protein JWO89_53 [Verrucomicrobiaceae bacterium]|nr:hypothetical protein [Verrucomicrobiaceae bacterium]